MDKADLEKTNVQDEFGLKKLPAEDPSHHMERASWMLKLVTFLCTILLAAGGHFGSNIVNSLKAGLKKELHIDNTQYASLDSALFVVNSFMPLLGGIFMDTFGTDKGSMISTSLSTLGNFIVALGAYLKLYWVMVLGRVIFGLGHGCIIVAQETILSHWFRGRGLAFVIGCSFASSKIFALAAQGLGATIVEHTSMFSAPFWVAFGFALASLLVNALYIYLVRRSEAGFSEKELETMKNKKRVTIKGMLELPKRFWLLPLINFSIGGVWTPFLQIAPEFLMKRFDYSYTKAGWYSVISLVFPIALGPATGLMIELFGFRGVYILLAGITLVAGQSLLGFTETVPAIGLVLYSISIAIGPVSLASSVPLILPKELIGTAFGFHQCALNAGVSLFALIAGKVQDGWNDSYTGVSYMFIIQASVVLILILGYNVVDYTMNRGIWNANSTKRQELLVIQEEERHNNPVKKTWLNYALPSIFFLILIFGLIMYLVLFKAKK